MQWLRALYEQMDRQRTFGLAAETAFWLFLSLIPLVAVGGLLAAKLSMHGSFQLNPVLGTLPSLTRQLVLSELSKAARWNGGAVGLTGIVAFLWLASSGIQSVFDALELELETRRPWLRQRALAVLTCIGLSVAIAVLAILLHGVDLVAKALWGFEPSSSSSVIWGVVGWVGSLLIGFGYVSALYVVGVPPRERHKQPVFAGATVAVLMQVVLGFLYGEYLSTLGGGGAYTEGLALVGITLMALYLFVFALLTGAAVNRKLAHGALEPHETKR